MLRRKVRKHTSPVKSQATYKKLGYKRYLGTSKDSYTGGDHWKQVRKKKWEDKKNRHCRLCDESDARKLVLHHRTYIRLGKEDIKRDLVVLCRNCHHEVHFLPSGRQVPKTYTALIARERLLYKRNKSLKHRIAKIRPSDVLNALGKMF